MSKNRFNGSYEQNTNNRTSQNNKPKRERPEPVYTEFQKDIAQFLLDQVNVFMDAQAQVDALSYDERRSAENALFSLASYPHTFNGYDDMDAYVVNRRVRVDRETHLLQRAAVTIVCINKETHRPDYVIEAFLNANGGTITVVVQDENGPVNNNTYLKSIKF